MDPELQANLRTVQDGDLILINAAFTQSLDPRIRPTYVPHLLVSVDNVERIRRGEDPYFVLVAPVDPQDARDLLLPYKPATWLFNGETRRSQAHLIETFMRIGFSSVILRPTVEVLRATIWQDKCPFHCERGSIRITPRTARELGIFVSHGRTRGPSWTLCPCCMGPALFESHEHLVQIWSGISISNVPLIHNHLRQVNIQRQLLHCGPFALNIDLPTLAFGTQTYLTLQSQRPVDQAGHDFELSSPDGLISKPASCYMVNGVMSPGDVCIFCTEIYNEKDTVIELVCGHRFHSDCLMPWLDQGTRTCPTCRALVPA